MIYSVVEPDIPESGVEDIIERDVVDSKRVAVDSVEEDCENTT